MTREFCVSLALLFASAVTAQDALGPTLSLPQVFSDHMVLQAGTAIPIRGQAPAGQSVSVQLGPLSRQTVANDSGRWIVRFPPRKPSSIRTTLTVRSGDETRVIQDVVFGDVWLCSGQSNMAWPLSKSANATSAIAGATDPDLRLLHRIPGTSGKATSYGPREFERLEPEQFCTGDWQRSSPKTAAPFSAVAWYFGRHLRKKRNVPIGLICCAVGGSPTEAWIPREAMQVHPQLRELTTGSWLTNSTTGQFCRDRANLNLKQAIADGVEIPGDKLGPNHPFKPGFMWEAGIRPLLPCPLRGVIWYQGESNAETEARIKQHGLLLPLLIEQWREHSTQVDLPFGMVQLPAMGRQHWPDFREQQRRISHRMTNVGMVVTIDTGHETNVHPPLKRPVGERLAAWALSLDSSAGLRRFEPAIVQTTKKALTVQVCPDKLDQPVGTIVPHFELAGADGEFLPCEAHLSSPNTVVVATADISQPRHVRYAWKPYLSPKRLLTSGSVPVSPFTTQSEQDKQEAAAIRRANTLFETSFESGSPGHFKSLTVPGPNGSEIEITTTGTASITAQFARTGKHCLHLLGDENCALTIVLPDSLATAKGIRFHAERWTRRDPFAFSIDVRQRNRWQELANLDTATKVGARFLTEVRLALPAETDAIRFRVKAASKSGLLIDDLALLVKAPRRQMPAPQ